MSLSMTGFSSHTALASVGRGEKTTFVVEMKSLNSRFFEVNCKLPSSLSFLEIPVVNYLKKKLVRGRVFLSVRIGGGGELFESVTPSIKVAKEYLDAAKKLQKNLKVTGELSLSDLIRLDNVFSFQREKVGKSFEDAVVKTIYQVADKLMASRKAEGSRLKKDLKARLAACDLCIEKIKKHFVVFVKEKKEELKNMIILAKSGDTEAEKGLAECYEFLNKIDIHEEIVRFKSHLKAAQKVLSGKEVEKGKRLEFTLQELLRETNTMAAKCSHFSISSVAVDIKVELEKMREQVQNIV